MWTYGKDKGFSEGPGAEMFLVFYVDESGESRQWQILKV